MSDIEKQNKVARTSSVPSGYDPMRDGMRSSSKEETRSQLTNNMWKNRVQVKAELARRERKYYEPANENAIDVEPIEVKKPNQLKGKQ